MPNSWQALLHEWLSQTNSSSRIAILGIGNTLRSDDAAGILAARALLSSRCLREPAPVLVLEAGQAPENSTARLRRFAPARVLLIDAAEMSEAPGTIRMIDMDGLDGMSASTHSLPLAMLARYLTLELSCDVRLLGIQPASNAVGERISSPVMQAVRQVTGALISSLSPALEIEQS